MRFSTTITALFTLSSTLLAVQGAPADDKHLKYKHAKHCPPKQFYYHERDCCLPRGGPIKYFPAPEGKHCPHNYYWSPHKECCVPKHEKHHEPKCPKGLVWKDNCCRKSEHHGDKKWDNKDDYKKDYKHDDKKWDDKHDDKKWGDKHDDKKWDDKHDDKKWDDKHDDKKWNGDHN